MRRGGVAELARKIGIAQPSVSNWNRVPAQRVIAVEGATGVSRSELRPDLYSEPGRAGRRRRSDRCRARAGIRAACHACSRAAPSDALLDADRATARRRDAAWTRPRRAGRSRIGSGRMPRSSANISISSSVSGRGELLPYASYYLTGFLHERPLARLRDDLAALGIERVESNSEPEDHAATLCEIMAGLAGGTLRGVDRAAQRSILREACRAVDGPLVCRHGEAPKRQILPIGRNARPAVSGNRSGSIHVRQLTSARWSRRDAMRRRKENDSRPPRFPSQGRHRRGRRGRDAGNAA